MNPILQGMALGYSAEQILGFLSKTIPSLTPRINKAKKSGYSVEKILDFVSKTMDSETYPQNMTPNEIQGAKSRQKDQFTKDLLQTGASVAGTAAAGLALKHALPQAIGQLGLGTAQGQTASTGMSPSLTGQQPVATPQAGQQITPNTLGTAQVSPQQPPVSQPSQPTIPQQQQPTQPEVKTIDVGSLLDKSGLKKHVDDLSKRIKDPKQIAAVLYSKYPDEMKAFQKESGKNMEDAIGDYLNTNPAQSGAIPAQSLPVEEETTEEQQPHKIETKSIVASPNGIGEVITSRNGKSIIEVGGKKHQVEDKNLLKPPKEAAVEALELIKGFTPEEMRSTHHMLNAYDEGEKKGFFVFHNGSAYVVDDITPEEYKELSEEVEKAKTTGETIIGKWASGEGSRGAGYNKVVKGVRERKVVPELKKKFRKLKVGYNLLAEWQRLLNEK